MRMKCGKEPRWWLERLGLTLFLSVLDTTGRAGGAFCGVCLRTGVKESWRDTDDVGDAESVEVEDTDDDRRTEVDMDDGPAGRRGSWGEDAARRLSTGPSNRQSMPCCFLS